MWFVLLTSFTHKIYRVPTSRGSKNSHGGNSPSPSSHAENVDEMTITPWMALSWKEWPCKTPLKSSKVSKNREKQMQLLTTCVAKCCKYQVLLSRTPAPNLGAIFWRRTCWTGCHLSGERWYQNFVVDLIKLYCMVDCRILKTAWCSPLCMIG